MLQKCALSFPPTVKLYQHHHPDQQPVTRSSLKRRRYWLTGGTKLHTTGAQEPVVIPPASVDSWGLGLCTGEGFAKYLVLEEITSTLTCDGTNTRS